MTLLDLSRAPAGSLLFRLARTFENFEPLSHLLAWTVAEPLPGEECEVTILELPRLALRFRAQYDTFDMKWRLYSMDYSEFFVSDVCIGDRDSVATQLLGLPQALILQNLNDEIRFVVPTPPPIRPKIKTVPFTTDIVLDRHSLQWLRMKRRYMIYDLHLSETMISTDTVAQTLYLALSRILAREYELTVPLLRSLRTDVPFSADCIRLLDLIVSIEDTHPNAVSVIFSVYQLAASNGYACPKDIQIGAMGEEQHVSAVCRPTQSTMLDFVSIDARDKRIQVNCPRKSMRGGRESGLYGYLARAKATVMKVNMRYVSDGFSCRFSHHKKWGWAQFKTKSPNEQATAMGDLLKESPEGMCMFAMYWMLVSGLRDTSVGSAERGLLLRTVRMYIGLHLEHHGDRGLVLALVAVAWKLAESGHDVSWPFVTDSRSSVPHDWIYFWKLQDHDVEAGGGTWSQAGHECLTSMVTTAQSAIRSTGLQWGSRDCSDSGPHQHEAFELPDYQSHPRGAPIADKIDMTSVDVSPMWMCDSDASLELEPGDLACLASPDDRDGTCQGVLGMLPVAHMTGFSSARNIEEIDPETEQPTKLSSARRLLYEAMSQSAANSEQWQAVADSFEAALQDLPLTSQAEREEAHGGLGYAYTKLGNLVEAEQHLNKSLPFDLSKHASTKARIAREMMTRVALDYQAYVKGQRQSSNPFLSCLPPELLELQMARAEGRSSATVNFSETIQGLRDVQKYLEAVRKYDMEFLLAATQSLTAKSNKVLSVDQPDQDRLVERCVFSLQRAAWYRPEISFSYLAGSILSSTMEQDLQALNPFLTPDAAASIRTMTIGVLLRSNRASWINITMSQVRKSIELVNETLESLVVTAGYSTPEARLACSKHNYQWESTETDEVLPLSWLREQEAKLVELDPDKTADHVLHLRYCGYDSERALALLSDPAEVLRLQGLCKRKCCDSRAERVRDASMEASGEMKMQAAKIMKTNLLMLKDSTKSAAGLLNGAPFTLTNCLLSHFHIHI